MPRFTDKKADVGMPVTIDKDRYAEGSASAILEGGVVLGEKPGCTVFPIQIDADGYLKIYLDGNATLQTEYEDDTLSGTSKGTLTMGDNGADLQNISVDVNGYLQAEVVAGDYSDKQYQDSAVVGSPYGTVMMGHDGSNVYPVEIGSNGHLQITLIETIFSNSVADVELIATSTTQIVGALTTRLCTLISSKRTNTQTFRIGDANVGATRGVELAPGESISIETNGAIYGYNPGATESILVLLREEDDNPEPPTAPNLISPIDGTVIANTSVTFQWNPCVGATSYHIRISTDPAVEADLFHETWTGATSKNYIDFPNDGTIYYWKVRAYNDVGWSDWSTIENFVNGEEEEPPDAPVLISPTNGSDVPSTSVTFQWNSSEGATSYHLRVSTDPGVETDLFHETWTGATSKNYTDFPNDGIIYYWKVRAYNDAGWGSWSTIWNFSNGDDGVPYVNDGHSGFYDLDPYEAKYFKFTTTVSGCVYPIQVGNTSAGGEPRTVHLTIKRGSKPTVADFELTWGMAPSLYDCGLEEWIPAKPGAETLYWKYNTGPQAEFVEIGEPMETDTYYIMLYNDGAVGVNNQRLNVDY